MKRFILYYGHKGLRKYCSKSGFNTYSRILQHIRVVKEKPGLSFMYMRGRCPFICKLMAGNYGYGNITKYVTGLYS